MNFHRICKILVSKINLKSQDKGDLTKGPFRVSLFLAFNQTSNNFFETSCTTGGQTPFPTGTVNGDDFWDLDSEAERTQQNDTQCDDSELWEDAQRIPDEHLPIVHESIMSNTPGRARTTLESYVQPHVDKLRNACSVCGKSFKRKDNLTRHVASVHGDKCETCTICNKTFSTAASLTAHVKRVHEGSPKSCPYDTCNKKYKDKILLTEHLKKTHLVAKYVCQECDKSFAHEHLFQGHLVCHTGVYAFECPSCQKKCNLREHCKIRCLQN